MRAGRAVLLLVLGLLPLPLAASGEKGEAPAPPAGWVSPLQRDHALVGTIWSAREGRAVSRDEVLDALSDSAIALLGEVHDNPDHHRLRAWLIGELARRRRQPGETGPAVVFEHIRADQQQKVDRFLSSPGRASAGALLRQLEWDRSGWPSASMFTPLFEAALRLDLPILGGNVPGRAIREVVRQGFSALPDEQRSRLGLDVQLETPLKAALIAEIEANHCGMLPESAFPPMALAQLYRDAHLAEVLSSAQNAHGAAVLIAGNGHIRADRGVPWHLRRRSVGISAVAVAFMEVDGSMTDAAAYVPRNPAGQPAVDYVWLTPRTERPDPCERMRQRDTRPEAKPSNRR